MTDESKLNVSPELFNVRLKTAALIAELSQITQMVDDPDFLTWKKNREFELIGQTQTKERKFVAQKLKNSLPKM